MINLSTRSVVATVLSVTAAIALASPLWAAQVAPSEDEASTTESQSVAKDPSVLRVCASTIEEPFSSNKSYGFENRIAEVLATAMGRKAVFVWYEKPGIYLVRDQLDKDFCDVVMGLDTGDERVLTSKPYYRAPYVFIQRSNSALDIKDWSSPDLKKAGKIGFAQDTPAQVMLDDLHLFGVNFNYMRSLTDFKSRRNQYVRIKPTRMVGEVANGTADLAVAFAPEVARYVKERGSELKMTVIPASVTRSDGREIRFHYDQSVGVRKGDDALLGEVNNALDKARAEIETILKDEGIPLVQAGVSGGRAG
jgi:mxaJ protein